MIKTFAFLLAISISSSLLSQTFEGRIVYRNSYNSKIPNMTTRQFTSMMGDTQEYHIKKGNYKSVSNGTLFQWQLYINRDNKLYSKMANSDTILWNDGALNADRVLSAVLNKNVLEVLGYKCDELVLTCKSGIQKYYFNSQLSIDSKLYEKHKYGNWFEFLFRTNAVPLKSIVDTDQLTLESVAIKVTPSQLDTRMFALPAKAGIAKSPY
ncbi:MAG: hypothetical protein H7122_19565 [Chitinophagaceae bacterium]|nr:hypothetical protein [Chitinophagaceae bacterium]